MKTNAKYLFDEDFASAEKPTITLVEHERRRIDAESLAHRKGFEAGLAQAKTEAAERIANALTLIGSRLERIEHALTGIEARQEIEAVQVAVAVASKLAPELIARQPFAELSALATECFRQLVTTPQIVVHISSDIYEAAKEKLGDIARTRGFDGRLIVQSDDTIASGDCRIEWADGGVNRDRAETLATIDDLVNRYVTARAETMK